MPPQSQPPSPSPPRGGTLVLLPGLVCDRAAWEPVLPHLGTFVDCRIHETGPDSSLGAMADRVLAVAPSSFALAGHSMGGRVALEIMRRAPQRVERLALLDTGFRPLPAGIGGENERAARLRLLGLARAEGMRAMGRAWARPMVHPAPACGQPADGCDPRHARTAHAGSVRARRSRRFSPARTPAPCCTPSAAHRWCCAAGRTHGARLRSTRRWPA